jgi:GNAT superfamily N-acetyltransferase
MVVISNSNVGQCAGAGRGESPSLQNIRGKAAWEQVRSEANVARRFHLMPLFYGSATNADAAAIAALRMATARDLTERFGAGTWSFAAETEASVQAEIRTSTVLFARDEGLVVGTLRLATRNPWIGNTDFFTPCERPIFLTSMAVSPKRQRQQIGRQLLSEAKRVAREMRGEALRLDSYAGPAGAAGFYMKCGFREVRRGDYNGTALIWFETPLSGPVSDRH